MTKNVLLVGESWVSAATHYKGFDQFGSVTFHLGAEPLVKALEASGFALTYMPAHEAAEGFPFDMAGLDAYDAIILSDIGSNTLLLPPAVWLQSKTVPNRLKLIRDWVEKGGGLLMVGGYFSFQGIDGKARWRRTAVEDTLAGHLPALRRPRRDARGHDRRAREAGASDARRASAATGRRFSASTRSSCASAPTRGPRPPARTTRAATRCSSSGTTARAAPPPGPPTSARTGCRRPSATGTGLRPAVEEPARLAHRRMIARPRSGSAVRASARSSGGRETPTVSARGDGQAAPAAQRRRRVRSSATPRSSGRGQRAAEEGVARAGRVDAPRRLRRHRRDCRPGRDQRALARRASPPPRPTPGLHERERPRRPTPPAGPRPRRR